MFNVVGTNESMDRFEHVWDDDFFYDNRQDGYGDEEDYEDEEGFEDYEDEEEQSEHEA